jgi:hypothetical protein
MESVVGAPLKLMKPILQEPLSKWSTPWSAAAWRRFGQRRLVAASWNQLKQAWPRQVATGQSAARPAHSKELPHSLDQSFLNIVTRAAYQLLFASAVVILSAGSSVAQTSATNVSGRWVWKQIARKNKSQTQFRIVIRRQGSILRGTYSVDEFVNGKWQGEDGNQTPFVGHMSGSEVKIEFDPQATRPGYEQNVSYAAPSDGRTPSVAIITRNGLNLRWQLVQGPGIEGIPTIVVLNPERR